jgi:hypothetical protein
VASLDSFQIDEKQKDTQAKLHEDICNYRRTLEFMGGNIPIQTLCLPPDIEKILLNDGRLRVYDLFRCDFGKIKGIGSKRLAILTSRLDEFFAISF